MLYAEGKIAIPVTITNTGSLDETMQVSYELREAGGVWGQESRNYYVLKGGSAADTLYYDLTAGSYQLSAVSSQPTASASVSFTVVKDPDVSMSTIAGSQGSNNLIPVTAKVTNNGYNTLNGSITLAVMNNDNKALWRGEAQVSGLASQTTGTYTVNVDSSGLLPGAYSTTIDLYSTSGQKLATNQTQVRVLGSIFEITSIPANPSFTLGKQGALSFTVKNTGTLAGSAALSVTAEGLLKQTESNTIQPGEEENYTFNFSIPEDAQATDYLADYVLSSASSQGTKGTTSFHVDEVKAEVTAALDKEAYRNGETAELTMTITKQSQTENGTYLAIIRYGAHHDMQTFTLSAQPVTLTFNVPLGMITGERLFYGVHFESGLAINRGTLSINDSMPDLAASFTEQAITITRNNTVEIPITVSNVGKAAAPETTISFFDGETLIDTKPVSALATGESKSLSLTMDVLGKAGDRIMSTIIDPQDMVGEISEENNLFEKRVTIPNLTLFTDTDKEAYKIRNKVYISSLVTNLTATTTISGLTLTTVVSSPSGTVVFTKSSAINAVAPMASSTVAEIWNTAGLPVDGSYTIFQTIASGDQLSARSSKLIALERAADFTLAAEVNAFKVKQGEQAVYTATLAPINGWNHETTLSMEGLPEGTSIAFNPDRLLLPCQSQTVVITTSSTSIGSHTLYLIAQGTDEGEPVAHTVPLTLDVSGYGLEATSETHTIKQLETAAIPISLTALNGYEGGVSLAITNLPNGTKANIRTQMTDARGQTEISVPGNTDLIIQTSKYVKPGVYPITLTGDDGLATHSLNLTLTIIANPTIAAGIITTPGPGPKNPALVRTFTSEGKQKMEIKAFDTMYGANAISADIDGDGYDELIVAEGPGPNNTATFKVFKRNGTFMTEYTAFDTKYGLTLASGDLDGDWMDELIVGTGPDPKNPGIIKVLKITTAGFTEVMTKTIYPDSGYGIIITAGDIDGDGIPELITAPGPGPNNPAKVTIWKYGQAALTEVSAFMAFDGAYGVNIATGDIDGDNRAEIITGTGPDPKNTAIVRIYNAAGALLKEFLPYDAAHTYGVNVSAGGLKSDGIDEIITGVGPGPQNESLIKIFRSDGAELGSFAAYPATMGYGVNIWSGNTGK